VQTLNEPYGSIYPNCIVRIIRFCNSMRSTVGNIRRRCRVPAEEHDKQAWFASLRLKDGRYDFAW
jgi:hypothetical protein